MDEHEKTPQNAGDATLQEQRSGEFADGEHAGAYGGAVRGDEGAETVEHDHATELKKGGYSADEAGGSYVQRDGDTDPTEDVQVGTPEGEASEGPSGAEPEPAEGSEQNPEQDAVPADGGAHETQDDLTKEQTTQVPDETPATETPAETPAESAGGVAITHAPEGATVTGATGGGVGGALPTTGAVIDPGTATLADPGTTTEGAEGAHGTPGAPDGTQTT